MMHKYEYIVEVPDTVGGQIPLLLFLHGMGERGDDCSKLRKYGPLQYIANKKSLPFCIVVPQCPEGSFWDSYRLCAVIDDVQKLYPIDKTKQYVVGFSMGGAGAWSLAAACPQYFAAMVSVSGFFTPVSPDAFSDLPIRCFHGAKDTIVPVSDSIRMIEWIEEHSSKNVSLYIDPCARHNDMQKVFLEDSFYEALLCCKQERNLCETEK